MKIFRQREREREQRKKIAHPFESRLCDCRLITVRWLIKRRCSQVASTRFTIFIRGSSRGGGGEARINRTRGGGEGERNGGPRKSGAALISTGEIHTLDKTRTDERAEGKRMTMKPRDTRSISFSPSLPLSPYLCVERVKINRNCSNKCLDRRKFP